MKKITEYILQDWAYNRHDIKIRIVLVAFRLAQYLVKRNNFVRIIALPYLILYKIVVFWFLHIELHWDLCVGEGLSIYHGYCLVIHPNTKIGRYVTLRHCVTIGNNGKSCEAPVLKDNVQVGANAIIIGPITIGYNAVIGSGSVVTKSVDENTVVVGYITVSKY